MDKMDIEILEDGTMKISTDQISMPNHTGAEGLIRELVKAAGGDSNRVRKANHVIHEHNGTFHSH